MNKISVGQSINMGAAVPDRKAVYEGLSSLKGRGKGAPSVEKAPSSSDNNDVEYKHGGSLTKRSSSGRVGVGAAQRGYGAVRSK